MDRRRRRWFAMDVHFYSGELGQAMLERFGTAGTTVFIAYLAACKRNDVPGQITVCSDADALAQMGLVGVPLVDHAGDNWDLTTFWRWLGDRHMTVRRRRGDLQTIVSCRWDEWQDDLVGRGMAAERMRRSRGRNMRDDTRNDIRDNGRTEGERKPDRQDLDLDHDHYPPTPQGGKREIEGQRPRRTRGLPEWYGKAEAYHLGERDYRDAEGFFDFGGEEEE